MAMARCSQCGMKIPLLGSICPYCRSPRQDVEAQGRAMGGAIGGMMAATAAFFLTGGFTGGDTGTQLGAIAGMGLVGLLLGVIFPVLAARLFALAVLGGIAVGVVYTVMIFTRSHPSIGIRAKIRPGMSASEVTAVLGEPPHGKFQMKDPVGRQKDLEQWIYEGADVLFDNGRVYGVRCQVFADDLKKVRVGMTTEEVVATLNALPLQNDRLTGDGGRPADVWNYNSGSVWFENGRVVKVQ